MGFLIFLSCRSCEVDLDIKNAVFPCFSLFLYYCFWENVGFEAECDFQGNFTIQEANVFMKLRANCVRDFTLGLSGGSIVTWLGIFLCIRLPFYNYKHLYY